MWTGLRELRCPVMGTVMRIDTSLGTHGPLVEGDTCVWQGLRQGRADCGAIVWYLGAGVHTAIAPLDRTQDGVWISRRREPLDGHSWTYADLGCGMGGFLGLCGKHGGAACVGL